MSKIISWKINYSLITFLIFQVLACTGQKSNSNDDVLRKNVIVGAERINEYLPYLQSKRVALVVNHTSLVNGTHLVDTLINSNINIVKVFAPEHGFRGKASAGEIINNELDKSTNLPIVSLYGNKKKPSIGDLSGVDIIVFDIQDVGARFYTYISTLELVMEAAAEQGIKFLLLDRPNPHINYIGGPVLDKKYKSFVGQQEIPIIYGLSIGEYGTMLKGEGWFNNAANLDLKVIYCENYTRSTYYELPVAPSPNLPNMTAIMLYPSLCLLEGTDFSEGRGTELPFQQYGHPQYRNQKYHFVPKALDHAKSPKWENQKCYGLDLSEYDPKALFKEAGFSLKYIIDAYMHTESQNTFFKYPDFFDKLAGNDQIRLDIINRLNENEIKGKWSKDLKAFDQIRQKYISYPL